MPIVRSSLLLARPVDVLHHGPKMRIPPCMPQASDPPSPVPVATRRGARIADHDPADPAVADTSDVDFTHSDSRAKRIVARMLYLQYRWHYLERSKIDGQGWNSMLGAARICPILSSGTSASGAASPPRPVATPGTRKATLPDRGQAAASRRRGRAGGDGAAPAGSQTGGCRHTAPCHVATP
jgi:hypothetical protein